MARGIKPPKGRRYFHRYKIRFDWVASQGTPWWERKGGVTSWSESSSSSCPPLTPSPSPSPTLEETASIPPIPLLAQPASPPAPEPIQPSIPEHRQRLLAGPSAKSTQNAMHLDFLLHPKPATGLLTPPVTPPHKDFLPSSHLFLNPHLDIVDAMTRTPSPTSEDDRACQLGDGRPRDQLLVPLVKPIASSRGEARPA